MAETKNDHGDYNDNAGGPAAPSSGGGGGRSGTATTSFVSLHHRVAAPAMTLRARRRREEAVRRLVSDIQTGAETKTKAERAGGGGGDDSGDNGQHDDAVDSAYVAEAQDWIVASTVAVALEKGLDRDLHTELVQEAKDNASRIGQICHDHADVFLASVAKVAALGEPSADLADGLKEAHSQLDYKTAGPMEVAARQWEDSCQSYAKAKTMHLLVLACQQVAVHLERARKQVGRPRAALHSVEEARKALATPLDQLFLQANIDPGLWKAATSAAGQAGGGGSGEQKETDDNDTKKTRILLALEQTPFGKRAIALIPKIENEVLMNARRGLNRWFLSLRSEGDGAKVGRACLRRCGHALAVGTGQLGLGGHLPPSYVWRAKTADNLISRLNQSGKVAKAVRLGYWFDRDAPKESEKLETTTKAGLERKVEAIAAAFGWYRCWEDGSALLVDPSEFQYDGDGSTRSGLSGSRHGLSGSRHGLSGSRHGLRGSRHGRGRSLGFRATTSSRSQAFQDITSTLGTSAAVKAAAQGSRWAELLLPSVMIDGSGRYDSEFN